MIKPIKLAQKNFLSSLDMSTEELMMVLELARSFKNKDHDSKASLGLFLLAFLYYL